jgi:Predicted transcriptional regulator
MKGPELASAVGSTPGFVSQVLTPLVRAGWVRSDPGPSGGYSLVVDLDAVTVLQVIEAIEGPTDTGRCVLEDRPCNEGGPCALHRPWQRARGQLLEQLDAIPIAQAGSVPVP